MTQLAPPDPMQEFKQRISEKIKNEIGSLLPDDALATLTQQAAENMFFKRETAPKPGRGWNSTETVMTPSWFEDAVRIAAMPLIEQAVAHFAEEHKGLIFHAISTYISEHELSLIAARVVGEQVRAAFIGAGHELVNELRNQGMIR